jgi:hypothetical protein
VRLETSYAFNDIDLRVFTLQTSPSRIKGILRASSVRSSVHLIIHQEGTISPDKGLINPGPSTDE